MTSEKYSFNCDVYQIANFLKQYENDPRPISDLIKLNKVPSEEGFSIHNTLTRVLRVLHGCSPPDYKYSLSDTGEQKTDEPEETAEPAEELVKEPEKEEEYPYDSDDDSDSDYVTDEDGIKN